MKFIKYSFLIVIAAAFTSCLKPKSDFGGIREDEGTIVTAIKETQYINTDLQNIGFHYTANFANFSFTTPNEQVRFFTLHIAQPRDNRMSGSMTVRVSMENLPGYDPLPAGAITVPAEITIPESKEPVFDFPVKFAVNKAGLDVNAWYGVRFTITNVSQGVYSNLDKSIDVVINNDPSQNISKYAGRFIGTTTVKDSANVYGINNNSRIIMLAEGQYDPFFQMGGPSYAANLIAPTDLYPYAFGLVAESRSIMAPVIATGARTAILQPVYKLDATGKVIDVLNRSTGTSLNPVFDPSAPNSFVVTANDQRVLSVKYTIRLTAGGLNRPFTFTEVYTYDGNQVTY